MPFRARHEERAMDRKVFYNGTILTMQAEGHTVEAVYTIGDRIAANREP